mmetsp:Transcript_20390/g.19369  ORF Transcript_20390/g.19369 Transcript_20390/m.19369 type:complete len:109 (+) Transcript_20390:396-722(+)
MEELGNSLLSTFSKNEMGGYLSLKSTAMLGIELIERLKVFHSIGYIHGDLKPQNILLSKNLRQDSNIYLIDFGVSQKYRLQNGSHIQIDLNEGYRGTIPFSSCKLTPL